MAPSSALPIGATRVVSEMQPVQIDPAQPGSGLLNSVLALLAPPNPDENERYDEEILDLNVVGFLVVCVLHHPLFFALDQPIPLGLALTSRTGR
jgi:polyribonucleotide 5'-hydroxyl-kinase